MKLRPKLLVPIGILALGLLGVVGALLLRPRVESTPTLPRPPLVRVERVESRPWQFVVRAHGTVAPRSQSSLISQVSGEVLWVSPELVSGGFFDEGEALLRVDPADYEVALESARASVARAESEFERATKELGRQKRLSDRSVASETRYDDAVNAERVNEATLREARARLDQATRDLARTEIRAPYTGRVRDEEVDVGQFVSRGSEVARIYAVDFAEVRLPIPDFELQYLDIPMFHGAANQIASDSPEVILRSEFAGADHEWRGRIVRTEGEIDSKSRMVHVVARVDDPYRRLGVPGELQSSERPNEPAMPLAVGLFVEAEILGRKVEEAVVLPRRALREGDRVLVVDDDSRLRQRGVEVLRREREIVVIASGLRPGERVCVSAIQAVVDGMQVRVVGDAPSVSAALTSTDPAS